LGGNRRAAGSVVQVRTVERTAQTTDLTGLIGLARSGRPDAVEQLIDLYAPRLYGLLRRMTGSPADAEDLLQETCIKMLRALDKYQEGGRFEPWLFSIAANLARDWLRRQGRSMVAPAAGSQDESQVAAVSGEPDVDCGLIQAEQADQLQQALADLSEAEREVVTLRFFSGLSFREIAEMLEIPLGTALARAHRGLKHLRDRIRPDDA
jgi:RNA polymerase sigma-70 factor, ECF subfamily